VVWLAACVAARADGKLIGPATYQGVPYNRSPQEQAQEAILIFRAGGPDRSAVEDLILRVTVEGEADRFAWVIPFPAEPQIAREDAALFKELYEYVETRRAQRHAAAKRGSNGLSAEAKPAATKDDVEVLSRKTVGSYDTAVVRERKAGALDRWLTAEGYQPLGEGAEDVVGFYRDRGDVFACIKVSDAALSTDPADPPVDLHPLRFTFETGGRDALYFPMKMTGLQQEPFRVNLYVFYGAWLNDALNRYGYVHRGFRLRHRDWDTRACKANAGKTWSAPEHDPYLRDLAHELPKTTALFRKLHPGARFYLTNLYAADLDPADVRAWRDDLWLFPYYTDRSFVPYDARRGGVAAAAWPDAPADEAAGAPQPRGSLFVVWVLPLLVMTGLVIVVAAVAAATTVFLLRRRRNTPPA
jgi:hypothetical protein